MSHFAMGVFVLAQDVQKGKLQEAISEQLEAYSEHLQVDEYNKDCYCINRIAERNARETLEAETRKTPEDFREEMKTFNFANLEEQDEKWQELTNDYFNKLDELVDEFLALKEADPECETCEGTGTYKSTYNPRSKWDWWSIGGRWSGILDDYDPSGDPLNMETCRLCEGTGLRNDKIGQEIRAQDPEFTCNVCLGKGKCVKWPTQWTPYNGDVAPVQKFIDWVNDGNNVFGYVTPEGGWIEKGKMGWWAITFDEKKPDMWKQETINILEKYNNDEYMIAIVDCHI